MTCPSHLARARAILTVSTWCNLIEFNGCNIQFHHGSSAIGKGTPEHAPATDFWGRALARGKAPDLGAFAFEPSLATEKTRIGWHGWPYRFAPQGEMDLPDPWALPQAAPNQ